MKNSIGAVITFSIALFLGHIFYHYVFQDVPNWSKIWEHTWFQINAIILYAWVTK